jgi:hypothetical protein
MEGMAIYPTANNSPASCSQTDRQTTGAQQLVTSAGPPQLDTRHHVNREDRVSRSKAPAKAAAFRATARTSLETRQTRHAGLTEVTWDKTYTVEEYQKHIGRYDGADSDGWTLVKRRGRARDPPSTGQESSADHAAAQDSYVEDESYSRVDDASSTRVEDASSTRAEDARSQSRVDDVMGSRVGDARHRSYAAKRQPTEGPHRGSRDPAVRRAQDAGRCAPPRRSLGAPSQQQARNTLVWKMRQDIGICVLRGHAKVIIERARMERVGNWSPAHNGAYTTGADDADDSDDAWADGAYQHRQEMRSHADA